MTRKSSWLLCVLFVSACTGDIGETQIEEMLPEGNPGTPGDPPSEEPPFHFPADEADTRPGLRRLSRAQLEAVYESVTGVSVDLSALPSGTPLLGLDNDAARLRIDDAMSAQLLLRAATDAADASDLDTTFPCSDGCSDQDLRAFLERTFVLRVDGDMLAPYRAIYDDALGRFDLNFARRAVMVTALLSPHVIYRTEIGDGGTLTAFERAEKLSYALWGTPPDDELRDAAFDGTLMNEDRFAAQANRLLEDARFRQRMYAFVFDWLGLDHVDVAARADDLPDGAQRSMEEEVVRLMEAHFFDEGTGLQGLMTSEYTFVDSTLATVYGLVDPGEGFAQVDLPAGRRGLLTTALVLAAHAKASGRSPMQRGKFLVDELLCYGFPADAGEAAMSLPADGGELTFREQFAQLQNVPNCVKCHRMLNAGFAFDTFDNVGRRWDEGFVPDEEAAGSFELLPFPELQFMSTEEAVEGLSDHPAIGACFTAQMLRYAQGSIPSRSDRALLDLLLERYTSTSGDPGELMRAIVLSERFLQPVEVTP